MKYGGSPVVKEREDLFRVFVLLKMLLKTHQVPLLFGDPNPTSLFEWATDAFAVLADVADEVD